MASDKILLPPGEIHIWKLPLRRTELECQGFEAILSDDERQRAGRYHFPEHRRRFIAKRGLQRLVLARYFECAALDMRFAYAKNGKPYIPENINSPGLHFNITQSVDMALLACTVDQALGIDVEEVRAFSDPENIVSRFFSVQEKETWENTSEADRKQVFFNAWTRKEAFIKALGVGLEMDLNLFSVSLETHDARLLSWQDHDGEVKNWRLYHLQPEAGFCGALAVPKDGSNIRLFRH